MFTKKLNAIILIGSQVLNLVMVLYFAVLLAKLVWWVINPSIGEVYVEKTAANQFDDSVKYTINRYPFGVIAKVVEVKSVAPPVTSQIHLTGVYFNPPDSVAFVEHGSKAFIYKVGDIVMDNARVMAINPSSIIISQNGESAAVELTHGSGNASPATYVPPPSRVVDSRPQPNIKSGTADAATDFRERRKKLIEEYANSGSDANAHAAAGNNVPGSVNNLNSNSNVQNNSAGNSNNQLGSSAAVPNK